MIEEWSPYLKEDDLHLIHDFIEKDILKHRFIHISFQPEQKHISLYMKKCMNDTFQDDCYIFTNEELTELEESTFIMNMIFDFEEPAANEFDEEDNFDVDFDYHSKIWGKYIKIIHSKKCIILPRLMNHSGLFKLLLSRTPIMATFLDEPENKTIIKSKIIVLTDEDEYISPGIERRMIKNTLLSEKEVIQKYSKDTDFQHELIKVTWHPDRFEKWCI